MRGLSRGPAAAEQLPGECQLHREVLRETAWALRAEQRVAAARGRLLRDCLGATRALAQVLRLQGIGGEQLVLADALVGAIESHLRDHRLA